METRRPTNPEAEELLGLYFPVLDHGFVALVDYMGTDTCIETAARLSYGAGNRKRTETRGLIRYLRRHHHSTPSEMVEIKLHCAMPIFIARQWIRHRTASTNEASGRYSLLPMVFYEPPQARIKSQSKKNRQGSAEELPAELQLRALAKWNEHRVQVREDYENMCSVDMARELARIDLPLSTMTQWVWKIDLHNLMHFLGLRVDAHAQNEFQDYGRVIAGMMKRIAPLSYEAWIDYQVAGVRFSRQEMYVVRELMAMGFKIPEDLDDLTPEEITEIAESLGSKREVEEFLEKLKPKETPDFELDLSKAKDASFFEEFYAANVPKVDQVKT